MSARTPLLQRINDLGSTIRDRPVLAYLLAGVAFALALSTRLALVDFLSQGPPSLAFFPAILLTAFFCGTGPGLLCAVLSGLAAWYFFIPVQASFQIDGQGALTLALHGVTVGVDIALIALIHVMHRTGTRLHAERRLITDLHARQATTLQELQHRVANNIQFIASLLMLQQLKLPHDSDGARALDEARWRLEAISRIHRRLHDPAEADQPVAYHLGLLTTDLLQTNGVNEVCCTLNADAVVFDLSRLTTLSMLVAEIVTNSLKHAFVDRRGGVINIDIQRLRPGRLLLRIADNGRGLPLDFDPRTSKRLGFKIINSLAAQLGGAARYSNRNGTVVEIEMPAPDAGLAARSDPADASAAHVRNPIPKG